MPLLFSLFVIRLFWSKYFRYLFPLTFSCQYSCQIVNVYLDKKLSLPLSYFAYFFLVHLNFVKNIFCIKTILSFELFLGHNQIFFEHGLQCLSHISFFNTIQIIFIFFLKTNIGCGPLSIVPLFSLFLTQSTVFSFFF